MPIMFATASAVAVAAVTGAAAPRPFAGAALPELPVVMNGP
jgi:hypothetical protein